MLFLFSFSGFLGFFFVLGSGGDGFFFWEGGVGLVLFVVSRPRLEGIRIVHADVHISVRLYILLFEIC